MCCCTFFAQSVNRTNSSSVCLHFFCNSFGILVCVWEDISRFCCKNRWKKPRDLTHFRGTGNEKATLSGPLQPTAHYHLHTRTLTQTHTHTLRRWIGFLCFVCALTVSYYKSCLHQIRRRTHQRNDANAMESHSQLSPMRSERVTHTRANGEVCESN